MARFDHGTVVAAAAPFRPRFSWRPPVIRNRGRPIPESAQKLLSAMIARLKFSRISGAFRRRALASPKPKWNARLQKSGTDGGTAMRGEDEDHDRDPSGSETALPTETADVIVVGSGSAGASAALTAAVNGLSVIMIEKSDKLGGTSAMSGAGTWVPANPLARAAGIDDSAEKTMSYMIATAPDGWAETEAPLWRALAEESGPMLEQVLAHTPLQFDLIHQPDPYTEKPGGMEFGRMLSPRMMRRSVLGPLAPRLRRTTMPHYMTYQEAITHNPYKHPFATAWKLWPRILWRLATGRRAQGTALMTGLLRGCLDAGVDIRAEVPARRLIEDDLRIVGVEVEQAGKPARLIARRAVILATGGFEWNDALRAKHFPGPMGRISSPRTNTGDGQIMAEAIGASLERMDQANISPALPVRYEGKVHGMPAKWQAHPSAILVDRHAQRFASEYAFDFGEKLDARDEDGAPLHLPVWVIGDQRYMRASPLVRLLSRNDPDFLFTAPTLPALAARIGLDPEALVASVARWNGFAAAGEDGDFHRGATIWEQHRARAGGGAAEAVGPIDRPPFVALRYDRPTLGTKGGARTNEKCQVLRKDGSVIAGLYFVGIGMASPIGSRPISAGTTIGPNMTFGYVAAKAILAQNT